MVYSEICKGFGSFGLLFYKQMYGCAAAPTFVSRLSVCTTTLTAINRGHPIQVLWRHICTPVSIVPLEELAASHPNCLCEKISRFHAVAVLCKCQKHFVYCAEYLGCGISVPVCRCGLIKIRADKDHDEDLRFLSCSVPTNDGLPISPFDEELFFIAGPTGHQERSAIPSYLAARVVVRSLVQCVPDL